MHCTIFCWLYFHSWNKLYVHSHSEKFVMLDFPSAECLNGQSSDMQYRLLMHLPTFLIPIRSFLLNVFILKYLRSWLFCTHSCGKQLILYSIKQFISYGSSSTHSPSILRNKCIGNLQLIITCTILKWVWLFRGCHLRIICKVNHIICII